jgi:hypothetical protein
VENNGENEILNGYHMSEINHFKVVFMGRKGMRKKFSLCRSYGKSEQLAMVLGC